jgi:aminoglycoside phosphotransferase family enzyme/predicted kinase
MAGEALPDYVRALLRKAAYPKLPASIELIQTHISWVFLTETEVFKLKKPVDLGFVNFTTLARRKQACEAEVRLNRRGCPEGVYLGVETLRLRDGAYHIGGEGEVVDYVVHMKRLPEERMMDRLLARGEVDFEMVGRLAARVAALHASAETGPEITQGGGTATLARNWRDNLDTMQAFVGRTLGRRRCDRIAAFVRRFLADESALLARRETEGWVRDCHGDMRSDAVCFDESLPGGICIYDCIEFNDAFRYGDTGLDAAFLAMDLDYRGEAALSDLFIGLYMPLAGDVELPLLLRFFKCYRACVRGKVESLLSADAGVPSRQRVAARRRAQAYFRLAESYTRQRARGGIVMVSGPSGSGKSVLAGVLASRQGAVLLATDTLRRRLFPSPTDEQSPLDAGIYAPEARQRVYEEMARRAAGYITDKRRIVLDATFLQRGEREPFLRLAREAGERLLVVECSAPGEVVRERQARRDAESWSTSEGRWEIYLAQKQRYEYPDELPASERLVLDTTRPLAELIAAVEGA